MNSKQGIVLGSTSGAASKAESPCNRDGERRFLELVAADRLGEQTARAAGFFVARGPMTIDELGALLRDRTAAQAALRAMHAVSLVTVVPQSKPLNEEAQKQAGDKRARPGKKPHPHTPEVYRLNRQALLIWFRQPQLIRLASREGEDPMAAEIMKDLLIYGKRTKLQLLDKHQESVPPGVSSREEAFQTLFRKKLVAEAEGSHTSSRPGREPESSGDDESSLFPAKRPKLATDPREAAVGLTVQNDSENDDDDLYFVPNYQQCNRYLLTDYCVELAAYRLDDFCASVLRALLSLAYLNRTTAGTMVQEESILEEVCVLANRKRGPVMDLAKVSSCLVMMSRPQYLYVSCSELDAKVYTPNIRQMVETMQKKTSEDLIGRTFGAGARRIFNQLICRPRIEQKQIADGALLPLKATREILYRLMGARLISFQEVPQGRGADYKLSRSFFLFYVDMEQVKTTILELCYKSSNNIIERLKHERTEKAKKDLTLVESAAKNEDGAQNTGPTTIDILDRSLLRLDRTICVLRDF